MTKSSPGYDRIPIFVIKDCLSHVLRTLTALLNLSFASSAFPRAWKKSEMVPHLKDRDYEIPNNYVTSRTFQSDREDSFESVH